MNKILKSNRGVVLVFVMAVALAMSAMVLFFQNKSRAYFDAFDKTAKTFKMQLLAEIGVEIGKEMVRMQNEKELVSFGADRTWPREKSYEVEGMMLSVKVDDENAKINPNKIFGKEKGEINSRLYAVFNSFFSVMGYSAVLRDSLLDWMDEDDIPRQNGAESFYYSSEGFSYAPPNRPLYAAEEILLVKDYTEDVVFGTEEEDGEDKRGLIDFITIVSDGKININTCTPEILNALGFTAENAEKIIAERKGRLLEEKALMNINREAYIRNRDIISFKSGYYSISSKVSDGTVGFEKMLNVYIKTDNKKTDVLRWTVI